MRHKHHIIPRHAGGTNDPSNIVLLTVKQHARAHKKLYEQYGRYQDYIAWRMLAGRITPEQARIEASRAGQATPESKERKRLSKLGNKHGLGTKRTPEQLERMSAWQRGVPKDTATANRLRAYNIDRKGKPQPTVTCHCGKTGGKPIMYRYHMDNCKL